MKLKGHLDHLICLVGGQKVSGDQPCLWKHVEPKFLSLWKHWVKMYYPVAGRVEEERVVLGKSNWSSYDE